MRVSSLIFAIVVGLVGAASTFAAENSEVGFYVFGGAGRVFNNNDQSDFDNALRSVGATGFSSSFSDPTVYKFQVGYQFMKYLAVEGGYIGSNNESYSASGGNLAGPVSASADISGWNLNAVGIWPVTPQFSLLGKLGVADLKLSGTVSGPGGSVSLNSSKTDVTYGIGAKYDFNSNIFMRLDVDRYTIGSSNSSSHTNVWMIDLGYKF